MADANRLLCLISAVATTWLLAACTEAESTSVFSSPPPREEVLTFEYRVFRSSPENVLDLANRFDDGKIGLERPSSWVKDLPVCQYRAAFDVFPVQIDHKLAPDEHTRIPKTNAYGNPGSPGFNFYVDAYQSRNESGDCPSLPHDIQGLELISIPGHASSEWRDGDRATLVLRPELGRNYLGPALEFSNHFQGKQLPIEYAIDVIPSDAAHITGRFRFLATDASGTHLVLVTRGEFIMNNASTR